MKIVQINEPFYHHALIGTNAERLALAPPFPYLYDEFIETDTNSRYVWTGTLWEITVITDFGYRRYGGSTSAPPPANSPIPVDTSLGGGAGLPFLKFLTLAGNSTGNFNLNGNYSATPTDFFYTSPANTYTFIKTVSVQISDASDFLQGYYGGIALSGGLANGVKFFINNGSIDIPLLSGFTFRTNNDWYGLTSHIQLQTFSAASQTLTIDFKPVEDYGCPLFLDAGISFKVRLNDDFTGLILHRFSIKCTQVAKP